MSESFVDLTYRGLSLGRRVKLTQVRPQSGYLETPAPMPVGTSIAIATDEGIAFEAIVTSVHEQVGGSDKPPGMLVAPRLSAEVASEPFRSGASVAAGWWSERVTLPVEDAPPPVKSRTTSVTVRPRSNTVVEGIPAGAVVVEAEVEGERTMPTLVDPDLAALASAAQTIEKAARAGHTLHMPAVAEPSAGDSGSRTTIMPAVDQELLEGLTRKSGEIENLVRRTGEHEVVDDGKMTMVMDAVDPAALGLDVGASGSLPAHDDDDNGDDPRRSSPNVGGGGGGGKKRRRRNR